MGKRVLLVTPLLKKRLLRAAKYLSHSAGAQRKREAFIDRVITMPTNNTVLSYKQAIQQETKEMYALARWLRQVTARMELVDEHKQDNAKNKTALV